MPLLLYEKHKLDSLKVSEYSDTSLISLKNIFAVNFYKVSGTGTSPVVMVPFDSNQQNKYFSAITLHLFVFYSLRTVDKFYYSVFTYCVPVFKTGGPFPFLFKI